MWFVAESGFALVITVVLLALLVLAVYALSTLSRVGADVSATGNYRVQARQHALLGLSQAIGALQKHASDDSRRTGMAGITGVPPGAGQPARHWCGVWDGNGQFLRWLASGADAALIPNLTGADSLALVANGSLGADATDREHVRALSQSVIVQTRDRGPMQLGRYAWWVGDEGVKLSALLPETETLVASLRHDLGEIFSPSAAPNIGEPGNLISYEQLDLTGVSAESRRRVLHVLGVTHHAYSGSVRFAGLLNVNSTSARYWRGIVGTYNRFRPTAPLGISPATFANRVRSNFAAAASSGKSAAGPFLSVDAFLDSPLLADALEGSGVTPAEFREAMQPWLTVRTDTFRVRAYGDAANPSDPTRIEATAWCEAIVQRVKDDPASPSGRFVITYFRWLRGPNPSEPTDSDI